MDLGFGDKNHEIGQATAQALIRGAEVQEKGVESELAQYDRLLDDEVSRLSMNAIGPLISWPSYYCITFFGNGLTSFYSCSRSSIVGRPRGPSTKTNPTNAKAIFAATKV